MSITFYCAPSPNATQVAVLLELLKSEYGLEYEAKSVDLRGGEQKESWFTKLTPVGKVPCLVDNGVSVWQSGTILQYLSDKYDKERKFSYAPGTDKYYQMSSINSFLMTEMSSSLLSGFRFSMEGPPEVAEKFVERSKQMLAVAQLLVENSKSPYLVGDQISLADVAMFGWLAFFYEVYQIETAYPALAKYVNNLANTNPAFKKSMGIPFPNPLAPKQFLPEA